MLKSILYTAIIGSLSLSTYAANEINDLDALFEDLSSSLEEENPNNDDNSLDALMNDLSDDSIKDTTTPKKVLKQNVVKKENKPEIKTTIKIQTEEPVETIYDLDKELNSLSNIQQNIASGNEQYLKYFPVDTSFKFNYDLFIPRKKTTFIYSRGERVLNANRENFSLCYIKFTDYDKPRKISKGRNLFVSNNITKKAFVKDRNKDVFFTTFTIDNDHVRYIKCMSDMNKNPLTLDDFYNSFGKLITVELPEYEQI